MQRLNPIPYLMFAWTMLFMGVSGLLASMAYFLIFNLLHDKHQAFKLSYHITRYWGKFVNVCLFTRVVSSGQDHVDTTRTYIIASNHLSTIDIPLAMGSSPLAFSFLAKAETQRIPYIGYLARNMHVLVNRKDEASRRQSFQNMLDHVQQSKSILIFVEGTRNRSGAPLAPFYDGAFKLAIQTQQPVLVLSIKGSDKVAPPRPIYRIYPFNRVELRWHPEIIETQGMTEVDLPALKTRVQQKMLEHLAI